MRLSDFITETLFEVSEGVTAAKEKCSVGIAPGYVDGEKVFSEQLVTFDISVTTGKEGGGVISVLTFGNANASVSREMTNRISFSVPVYFQAPRVSK